MVVHLWNGMFDFNGDGRMDIGEELLAYRIFEAVTEESENDEDDLHYDEDDRPRGPRAGTKKNVPVSHDSLCPMAGKRCNH